MLGLILGSQLLKIVSAITVENRIGDSVGFLKDLALFYAYNFMGLVVHAKDNRATLAIGKSYNSLDKLDTLFRNISLELKHL